MWSITSRCSTSRRAVIRMQTVILRYCSNSSISIGAKVSREAGAIQRILTRHIRPSYFRSTFNSHS